MVRRPLDASDHPVARARRLLFGGGAPDEGSATVLERGELWRSFARVLFASNGGNERLSGTPNSWRGRVEEARKAYLLLDDLLAGKPRVWIESWTHDSADRLAADETVPSGTSQPVGPRPVRTPEPEAPKAQAQSPKAQPRVEPQRAEERGQGAQTPLFGRYLYSKGVITLSQLVAAVVWQRKSRPSVGQIAVQRKFISLGDVLDILRKKQPGELFCDCGLRCGYLTNEQVDEILAEQRGMQKKIGTYFVDHGILSRTAVERFAAEARASSAGAP